MKDFKNISKWLNDEMSVQELAAFRQTEDYKLYNKIVEGVKNINIASLNEDIALLDFKNRIKKSNKKPIPVILLKYNFIFKIAASFILLFGLTYFLFNSGQDTIKSKFSENKTFIFEDESLVTLNAVSKIEYDKSTFAKKRSLKLDGEAYFDVKKGSSFNVKTLNGQIKVLGTKFNVKSRNDLFKVFCYEGKISVTLQNNEIILTKGEGLQLINNKLIKYIDAKVTSPSWLNNESNFNEEPYYEVLAEFERQFNVKIITNSINTKVLFSGGFNNKDFVSAIKSITLPLNIKYIIKENKIVLSK